MSEIGQGLWFGVHLKDYTQAEKKAIIKNLQDVNVKMKLGIDADALRKSIQDDLNTKPFKIDITPTIKTIQDVKLKFDKAAIRQELQDAVQGVKAVLIPTVNTSLLQAIKLNVDKDDLAAKINDAIKNANISVVVKSINTSGIQPLKLKVDTQYIRNAISTALASNPFSVTIKPKIDPDVQLKANIVADQNLLVRSIQDALNNRQFKAQVELTFNKSKFVQDLQNLLAAYAWTIDVKANLTNLKNITVSVNQKDLRKDVQDALNQAPFKAKVDVIIDRATANQAVRDAFAKAGLRYNSTASDVRDARIAEIQQRMTDKHQLALLRLQKAQQAAARAAGIHTSASLRLGQSMGSNLRIAGELGSQMASIYSIYTMEHFIRQLIEIGGEFEKQKLALGSMLGDMGKATELFNQIKGLAVESPFQFKELTSYTKQLKAYSIPYNELYETTKRLADISAGVGVDMGRIILAYGQVRSASFLRGQELRQFTEAGIPLLDQLADRFSKLEGRVVSAGEVIDMISKKKVTFGDVKDVLWQMTDEGGQFYQMQEVLADSLAGKWSNLKDSWDIMMADIASSTNWILKGGVEQVRSLMKAWGDLARILSGAIVAYGVYKVWSKLTTMVIGEENLELYKNAVLKQNQVAANLLAQKSYRTLTAEEQSLAHSSNTLTNATLKQMVAEKALTKEQALRLIAMKKIKATQAGYVAQLLGIKQAELNSALAASRRSAIYSVLGDKIKMAGRAMKAMMFNPFTMVAAGLTAAIEMWGRYRERVNESKKRVEDLNQAAIEGFKKLQKESEKFNGADMSNVTDSGYIQSIKDISEVLKDYSSNAGQIFAEADKIDNLSEKYKYLAKSLNDVKDSYELTAEAKEVFEMSNNESGIWLIKNSLSENLQKYTEAEADRKKTLLKLSKYSNEYYKMIEKAMKVDSSFASAAKGKNLSEQIELLYTYGDTWRKIVREMNSNCKLYFPLSKYTSEANQSVNILNKTIVPQIDEFVENVKKKLEMQGYDFKNKDADGFAKLTKRQEESLRMQYKSFLKNIEGLTDEIRDKIANQYFTVKFNIRPEYAIDDNSPKTLTGLAEQINQRQITLNKSFFSDNELKTLNADNKGLVNAVDEKLKEYDEAISVAKRIGGADGKKALKNATENKEQFLQVIRGLVSVGNTGGGGSSKKDVLLDALKEQKKEIENVVSMYEKLSQIYGKAEALKRTMKDGGLMATSLFGDATPENFEQKVIEKYRDLLKNLPTNTKDRKLFSDEVNKKINVDLIPNIDKEALDVAIQTLKDRLKQTSEQWNLYKQIKEQTGRKDIAISIAFGDEGMPAENYAEELKRQLQNALAGKNITFSEILGWNSKKFKSEGMTDVEPLVEAYKNASIDISKDTRSRLAEMIKANLSYADKVKAIDDKLVEDKATAEENRAKLGDETTDGIIKNLERVAEEEKSALNFEEFKRSSDWAKVFDDLDRVSMETLNNMASSIESYLKNAKLGTKETKELVKAFRDINSKKTERNPLAMFGYYSSKISEYRRLKKLIDSQGATLTKNGKSQKAVYDEKTKKNYTSEQIQNMGKEAFAGMSESTQEVVNKLNAMSSALSLVSELLDAIGSGGLDDVTDAISKGLSGATTATSALSAFGIDAGPWGAAAGAALGVVTSVLNAGDRKLQKAIEESKQRVAELKDAYDDLGDAMEQTFAKGDNAIKQAIANLELLKVQVERSGSSMSASYSAVYEALKDPNNYLNGLIQKNQEAEKVVNKFSQAFGSSELMDILTSGKNLEISINAEKIKALKDIGFGKEIKDKTGITYMAQYASLVEQRAEVEGQLNKEENRGKKKSSDKISDYKEQIADLNNQIASFVQDTIASLFDLDLTDWADNISTAITDAFQNGEDAVKAFEDTVNDMLRNVTNAMVKEYFIMPIIDKWRDALFGENGKGGIIDMTDLKGSMPKAMEWIKNTGVPMLKDNVENAQIFWEGMNDLMGDVFKENESNASGLSASISGVTEQTADLLASYINAIRADVSVNRESISAMLNIINENVPRMNYIAEAQLQQLQAIAANTGRSADNGDSILSVLNAVVNGTKKFKVG